MGLKGAIVPLFLLHGTLINASLQRSCGWLAIGAKAQGGRMDERRFSDEESQHIPAPRSEIRAGSILVRQDCLLDLETPERGR
jgi:hypothetical protein